MIKVEIAPTHEENFPGNLTELFEDENLLGFVHWTGPLEVVTPDNLQDLISLLKNSPQKLPLVPVSTELCACLITGSNESAKFSFFGPVSVKIQRGDKIITLTKNATGKLLETDKLSFIHIPQNSSVPSHHHKMESISTHQQEDPSAALGMTHAQENGTAKKPTITIPKFLTLHQTPSMFRTQKVNLQNFFRQKRTLYFSAVILLVLVSSILYQLRSRTSENMLAGLKELETQANSQIRDAQNLSEINIVLARSQLLAEKDDFLKAADQKFPGWQNSKEPPNPQIQKIASALNSQIQALSKSYKLTDLPIFYDFNILKSEAKISATTFYDGKLLALDSNLGTIFSLKTDNKNGAIVTTQDRFKNSSKIDLSGDQIETLLSNSVSGYPKNVAINKSESWGNMVSMRMFAGNVYLLDKDKNMIWKYMSSESGFSEIKQYLASGLSINFSKAVDLAIDGDVYVLTESGSVTKFTGGLPQDFGLKGLVDPLVKPTAIFTTDITQNIYILDNNRVVVVDKKGNYQSQYVLAASPSPLAPTIGADEAIKKIFLFSGSKVFGIEIK